MLHKRFAEQCIIILDKKRVSYFLNEYMWNKNILVIKLIGIKHIRYTQNKRCIFNTNQPGLF